jgi:4-hydroxybenzoate polyprenyltransferase
MSWTAFFGSVAWTWLHLLQFNLSNQLKGVDEDIRNKPYRPLAAGRMSLETAEVFRWRLWWFCVAISGFGGWPLVAASLGFLITGYVYDETILSAHWIGKSIGYVFFCSLKPRMSHASSNRGVSGYSTLEAGAALVIRSSPGPYGRCVIAYTFITGGASDFDIVALLSFGLFAAILLTTLHAQDFADRVGDAAIGRVTFPILFPEASRIFTFASVLAWSYGLTHVWNIGPISSLIFGALGLLVAGRYYRYRTVEADTQTFVVYNASAFFLSVEISRLTLIPRCG